MSFVKTQGEDGAMSAADGVQERAGKGCWVKSSCTWDNTPNLYLVLGVQPGCTKAECERAKKQILVRTSEHWSRRHIDTKGFLAKFCPMPKYEMIANALTLPEWRAFWVSVASNKVPYIPGLEAVGGMGYHYPSLPNGEGGAWQIPGGARVVDDVSAIVRVQWADKSVQFYIDLANTAYILA